MKLSKFGLVLLLSSTAFCFNANAFETTARNAILMDFYTGEYL